MKRHLPIIIISIVCSTVSALVTAFVVAHYYHNIIQEFTGARPGDYLVTAAKIREGKTDELVKSLEWNAQVEFIQQRHAKNSQWSIELSHQVLDAYKTRYDIELADPLRDLHAPEKRFTEAQFIRYLSLSVPDEWPEWFSELSNE